MPPPAKDESEAAPEKGKCGCGRGGCWYKLCGCFDLASGWENEEDGVKDDKGKCDCGAATEVYPLNKESKW